MMSRDCRGFTLVELMTYTVLSAVAMTAIFSVMVNQSRHLRGQLETRDVRETLRSATALLGTDLRQLSATRGDIYALGANALTVRSIVGGGLICGVHPTLPRYGLWRPGGVVEGQPEDSVMFDDPASGWTMVPLKSASDAGLPNCDWSPGYQPTVVVEVDSLPFTPPVGSPLLVFRRVEYGIFQWNDRWWLGQKVGSAKEFEVLTGPLVPPMLGGLGFKYFDASGAETADPAQVAEVQMVLRGESQRKRPNRRRTAQGDVTLGTFATDSVITKVFLRN